VCESEREREEIEIEIEIERERERGQRRRVKDFLHFALFTLRGEIWSGCEIFGRSASSLANSFTH
jgi:hypothetical protein